MKKKLFLFSFLGFVLFYITVKFYLFPFHYKMSARHYASLANIERYQKLATVDYLIAGDSFGLHSIQPLKISPDSYSVSISGASLMDTYYLLNRIDLTKIKKGLILTNSMYFKNHYEADFWDRLVLFDFYSFSEMNRIYDQSLVENIFPSTHYSKPYYFLKYFKEKLLLNKNTLWALLDSPKSIVAASSKRDSFENKIHTHKGFIPYWPEDRSGFFDMAYLEFFSKEFTANATDIYYLKKILEFTKSKNLAVYFIQPPIVQRGVNSFESGYQSFFQQVQRDNKHFYFHAVKTIVPEKDFYDFYHININGSDKIMPEILDFLKNTDLKKVDTQTAREPVQKQGKQKPGQKAVKQ